MSITNLITDITATELSELIIQICTEVLDELSELPALNNSDLDELGVAAEKLGAILNSPGQLDSEAVTHIGQLGHQTLSEFIALDRHYLQGDHKDELNLYSTSFCFWIVHQGGAILALDAAVSSLAYVANHVQDTETLGWLSDEIGHVIEAVPDSLRQTAVSAMESDPWQVLNLNRGIIATRSHDTERMEDAFERLITLLPDDACNFFKQGMEQMDIIGYPDPVRQIMLQYYTRSCEPQQLH